MIMIPVIDVIIVIDISIYNIIYLFILLNIT